MLPQTMHDHLQIYHKIVDVTIYFTLFLRYLSIRIYIHSILVSKLVHIERDYRSN